VSEMAMWIARLEAAFADVPADAQVAHRRRRLLLPGFAPLNVEGAIIRVLPLNVVGVEGGWPGKFPHGVSILEWLDVPPMNLNQDAAVARAISALLALVLNRRIETPNEFAVGHPNQVSTVFLTAGEVPDTSLYAPVDASEVGAAFEKQLTLLLAARGADRDALAAAIRLHHAASLLMEHDLATAYVLLVAGVETLAARFGVSEATWARWDRRETWDRLIAAQKLAGDQAKAIRSELMRDRSVRLRQTFALYGSTRPPGSFWEGSVVRWTPTVEMDDRGARHRPEGPEPAQIPMETIVPKDRERLRRLLLRSYDARSGFVHVGREEVDVASVILEQIEGLRDDRPLSFMGLRLLLRALILAELGELEGAEVSLPPLKMYHSDPREIGNCQADDAEHLPPRPA